MGDSKRLVLTRRAGESFVVGEAVVSVVRLRGGGVRLMIEAPERVAIVRSELLAQNRERSRLAVHRVFNRGA